MLSYIFKCIFTYTRLIGIWHVPDKWPYFITRKSTRSSFSIARNNNDLHAVLVCIMFYFVYFRGYWHQEFCFFRFLIYFHNTKQLISHLSSLSISRIETTIITICPVCSLYIHLFLYIYSETELRLYLFVIIY